MSDHEQTVYRYLQLGSKEWLILCPKDALYLFREIYSLGISMKSEVISYSQKIQSNEGSIQNFWMILKYSKNLLLIFYSNLQISGIHNLQREQFRQVSLEYHYKKKLLYWLWHLFSKINHPQHCLQYLRFQQRQI